MDDLDEVAKAGYESMHPESKWEKHAQEEVKGAWRNAANALKRLPAQLKAGVFPKSPGEHAHTHFHAGHKNWDQEPLEKKDRWKIAEETMLACWRRV